MSAFRRQTSTLLWKNFLLQKRRPLSTGGEILFPIYIVLWLWIAKVLFPDERNVDFGFPPDIERILAPDLCVSSSNANFTRALAEQLLSPPTTTTELQARWSRCDPVSANVGVLSATTKTYYEAYPARVPLVLVYDRATLQLHFNETMRDGGYLRDPLNPLVINLAGSTTTSGGIVLRRLIAQTIIRLRPRPAHI